MVSLAIWKKIHSWVFQRLQIALVQFWSSLKNLLVHVFSKLHSKSYYYPYPNVSVFIVVKYFTVVVFKDLVLMNIFTTHLRISRESRVHIYYFIFLYFSHLYTCCQPLRFSRRLYVEGRNFILRLASFSRVNWATTPRVIDIREINIIIFPQLILFLECPATLLHIVLVFASVWKISLIRRYTLTYSRGTLGIGCIRFKHGRIRRGPARQKHFFKHAKKFCAYSDVWLYDKHTLGTHRIR